MNLANAMTFLRMLLIPVVIALYYSGILWSHLLAALVFSFACLTDWLDGYLARRLGQCTEFGAFLDPVADKLLITSALVVLAANYTSLWFVAPAVIMVAREVLVSALREWMATLNQREATAVRKAGKAKTALQMLAIIVLLASDPGASAWFWGTGYALVYAATALTLYSLCQYLRCAWRT